MEVKPKSLFGGAKSSPVFTPPGNVATPKSILKNATKRNRIEVSFDELRQYSTNEVSLRLARQIILETNLDDLRYETVLKIGQAPQERHGQLVQKLIEFSQHPEINKAKKLLADIIGKLEGFDEKGFLGKLFGGARKFSDIVKDLTALSGELKALGPALISATDAIKKLKDDLKKIEEEIDPYIISNSFFSDYKKDDFPADLFVSRLASLIATLKTIKDNHVQADALYQFIFRLVDNINNILLTELPAWCSLCLTDSLNGEVNEKRKQLIAKLK
jgi:hypothetical protein